MKYWYDTEFYEDGKQIHLISIGVVAEDGRELYLENADFDWNIVPLDHWLWDNVAPHLQGVAKVGARKQVLAEMVKLFITNCGREFDNELWGYYSAYDHVVLAQLFGRMVDMPEGIPWFTRDIKQELERLNALYFKHGLLLPEQKSTEHHALEDAKWNRQAYEFLVKIAWDNYGGEIIDGWA